MVFSVYQCLLSGKDYAVGTETLNKNWVREKWKKPQRMWRWVVTGRIMHETSGVCLRVAAEEEKEIIYTWGLIESWDFFYFQVDLEVCNNLKYIKCNLPWCEMPAQEEKQCRIKALNRAVYRKVHRQTLLATPFRCFSGRQHPQVLLNQKWKLSSVRDLLAEK